MDGDTENVCKDIKLKRDPDPFCTSSQIFSMKKKSRSKNPLRPRANFRWVFMNSIPATALKRLTSKTTFSKYILIFAAYSKIPRLYALEKNTAEEVIDKWDMFESRFGKIDGFGCWDLEGISEDSGTQFTSTDFWYKYQTYGVHMT